MEDWAEKAAAVAAEKDRSQEAQIGKANRDARIKVEVGPKLFKQLQEWLLAEVDKYNRLRGSSELVVESVKAVKPKPALLCDRINVKRSDGKKSTLKINLSSPKGDIHYDYGGSKHSFTLTVDNGGRASFKTSYHAAKTIEEIGTEMLSKFQESEFQ
jgi:hypothetical protein